MISKYDQRQVEVWRALRREQCLKAFVAAEKQRDARWARERREVHTQWLNQQLV